MSEVVVVVVVVVQWQPFAVLLLLIFDFAGGAWAWTRQAPWYLPCGEAVCVVFREFAACVCV